MKLVRENISFERGQNPKSAMGIGKIEKIKKWLDLVDCRDYTIDDDGYINANKPLSFNRFTDEIMEEIFPNGKFPSYIRFKTSNNFDIDCCNLISLIGCPKIVNGFFSCSENRLESLIGFPEEVTENVYCFGNEGIRIGDRDINEICEIGLNLTTDDDDTGEYKGYS